MPNKKNAAKRGKQPENPTPYERALQKWLAWLSSEWQSYDSEMTDATDLAINQLIARGYVQAKLVRPLFVEGVEVPSPTWRICGDYPDSLSAKVDAYLEFHYAGEEKKKAKRGECRLCAMRLTASGQRMQEGIRNGSIRTLFGGSDGEIWDGVVAGSVDRTSTAATLRPSSSGTNGVAEVTGDDRTVGDTPLSERQTLVLIAMLEKKAFDSASRQTTVDIAAHAEGGLANADGFKEPVADLGRKGYVLTKRGKAGGCWLTESGRTRAEALDKR